MQSNKLTRIDKKIALLEAKLELTKAILIEAARPHYGEWQSTKRLLALFPRVDYGSVIVAIASWPKFTGSIMFPVKIDKTLVGTCASIWAGTEGVLRAELCIWIINKVIFEDLNCEYFK